MTLKNKKKTGLNGMEVLEIMENESFAFVYKKDGIWRIQHAHSKKEKNEIRSLLIDVYKLYEKSK